MSAAAASLPVAVDAMGGDRAPESVVAGAVAAAADGVAVTLYGRTAEIAPLLAAAGSSTGGPSIGGPIPIVEATETIAMSEDPARAARTKKDSSLVRAVDAVRDGEACAMMSAGNTGAAAAAALLRLRRLRGVARPAIATALPVPGRHPVVLLDAGAMADCQPDWLHQFARMGAAYCRVRYGIDAPAVGLMSIGEEPGKGNALVKAAHGLLAADGRLGFAGNLEGRDVLQGDADVVVTDGFTGNVVLKTLEGAIAVFTRLVVERLSADADVGPAALDLLAPLVEELHPDAVGGAMLLGVRGVCIISHGSSSPRAIANAVRAGHEMAAAGLLDALAESVEDLAG